MPFVAVASADRELASKTQSPRLIRRAASTPSTRRARGEICALAPPTELAADRSLAQEQPNVQVGEEFCP